MFIKTSISASIRVSVEKHTNVRALLKAIDKQFLTSDKALSHTLIMEFSSLRITNVKGVREHIMEMRDIAAQRKTHEVDMSNTFLVHYILNNLPMSIKLIYFKTIFQVYFKLKILIQCKILEFSPRFMF